MTDMVFADELPEPDETIRTRTLDPWVVMIVDDDPAVHQVTQLVMADFEFAGRRLQFLSAYSGSEARDVLRDEFEHKAWCIAEQVEQTVAVDLA